MTTPLDIISNTPLFNGLPPPQLAEMQEMAVLKTYNKHQIIFSEGDTGDGFYIAVSGKVKISKVSPDGKEQILHIFGPGEPFGEVPVFSGSPFPATAMALQNSRLLFFARREFIARITRNPDLALNMLAVLARRLRSFVHQIENLSLKEVPARLSSYLLLLAREQQTPNAVQLDISKGHLASLLGTVPETLSRILARMSSAGLIEVDGSHIHLLNHDELTALAEQQTRLAN